MIGAQFLEPHKLEKSNPNEEIEDDDEQDLYNDNDERLESVLDDEQMQFDAENSQCQTLPSESCSMLVSMDDIHPDLDCSLDQLSDVLLTYETESIMSPQFKERAGVSHEYFPTSENLPIIQDPHKNQNMTSGCQIASEFSPTSVIDSISSSQTQNVRENKALTVPKDDNLCVFAVKASDLKIISPKQALKTPSPDGYNWRKYGQKQVKSPEGYRSYYKCTYSDCDAKKIGCIDHSSGIIDVIYKGQHIHEPPKINCVRENRLVSHASPAVENYNAVDSVPIMNGSDPSIFSVEPIQEKDPICETEKVVPNSSDVIIEIRTEENHVDESESKRRLSVKGNNLVPYSCPKPAKKPKFVVHEAGDVGICSDGYRWRKYGQKMVKGNLNPRNYYRCTSSGCPVRKHTEMAADNKSSLIVTYSGIHDHGTPVPKRRNRQLITPIVFAAPATNYNGTFKEVKVPQSELTSSQWSADRDKKPIESAGTLVGFGFEIKPC